MQETIDNAQQPAAQRGSGHRGVNTKGGYPKKGEKQRKRGQGSSACIKMPPTQVDTISSGKNSKYGERLRVLERKLNVQGEKSVI